MEVSRLSTIDDVAEYFDVDRSMYARLEADRETFEREIEGRRSSVFLGEGIVENVLFLNDEQFSTVNLPFS